MSLSHKHVGIKMLAKIKIYTLTRAELLFPLCYEIPCNVPGYKEATVGWRQPTVGSLPR